jgi:branched-chain amino acid transport system substrate-binding protein
VDYVLSGALINAFGARAQGVAWAWPNATEPTTKAWRNYRDAVRKAFPRQSATTFLFAVFYYTSMQAVLRALEAVQGDLSEDGRRFREALAASEFQSPLGPVRLDRNRQVVATNQVAVVDVKTGARTVRTIAGVDQTFGGYFHTNDPPPGPTDPPCRHGNPPSWAK